MTIRIESVVICDDVRQEANGKHILIGVYSGGIGLRRLPVNMTPSVWIQFWAEKGDYTFDFRIEGPGDSILVTGRAQMSVTRDGLGAVTVPRLPIQLQKTGTLKLKWKLSGQDNWETMKEVEVTLQASSPATVSAQPAAQSPTAASS